MCIFTINVHYSLIVAKVHETTVAACMLVACQVHVNTMIEATVRICYSDLSGH